MLLALESFVAGIFACILCGLGVLPLFLPRFDLKKHSGIGYGFAGGMMVSASVYNLIVPGLKEGTTTMGWSSAWPVLLGIFLGAGFLSVMEGRLSPERMKSAGLSRWGTRTELLIFLAMFLHSIPEGVAVGAGYASGEIHETRLGFYIALAIGIHNIPEGLAVAIPMRANGAGFWRCFTAAFLTSLPQPIAAVPASLIGWFFQPFLPIMMGFAAGAMIFLVILEMIPDALQTISQSALAWSFISGFSAMLLLQVVL